jgi:hypothetical protein
VVLDHSGINEVYDSIAVDIASFGGADSSQREADDKGKPERDGSGQKGSDSWRARD